MAPIVPFFEAFHRDREPEPVHRSGLVCGLDFGQFGAATTAENNGVGAVEVADPKGNAPDVSRESREGAAPQERTRMATEYPRPFFTIGHSTRSVDEVVDLLKEAGADMIVDVRAFPRSRANPQFNIDVLPNALGQRQVGYCHLAALGGLRGRQRDLGISPNIFWTNKSFRNYADYAMTPAFEAGFANLATLGQTRTCAIMCAEILWWRCHRRIISDYLLLRGASVFHILGRGSIQPAVPTPGVEKVSVGLVYRARGEAGS